MIIKNLLVAVLILWLILLCLERSIEPSGANLSRTDVGIRLIVKRSVDRWSDELKSARTRKDRLNIERAASELALAYWQNLDFKEARATISPLLVVEGASTVEQGRDLVPILQIAAGIERDWGKYDKASRSYTQALDVDHRCFGIGSAEAIRELDNLGIISLLESMQQTDPGARRKALETSEQYLERALSADGADEQTGSLRTAVLLSNQSIVSSEMGEDEKSAAIASKAKRIWDESGGRGMALRQH